MRERKIKDNYEYPVTDFEAIHNLTDFIANKTLLELQNNGIFVFPNLIKDAEDLEDDQMILQEVNETYRAGNIMGFIGRGDERLIIESRFSKGEDYFFQYLLNRVFDMPNLVDLLTEANQENRLYNLMLFLFPKYLQDAMRKGLFKTYIRREYNDANVRGTIDIARHIKKNIPFVGNIAYNQREFDYDNYLMQLIRHTVEYIKTKPYGNAVLSKVKDEVELVVNATPSYRVSDRRHVIEENRKNIVRHAYYHEYRSLQTLCILILRNEKHQIGLGNRRVYGILFDGAWLWEEYVNLLVGELFYHPMNKAGKGGQSLFAGGIGRIYPDFLGKDPENRIIADAKYKRIEGIKNPDYFQVLAYMYRFDAKLGYYFYPEANYNPTQRLWLNSGSNYEKNVKPREDICLVKYGLKIPNDATSFDDFAEKIKVEEENFRAGIMVNRNI